MLVAACSASHPSTAPTPQGGTCRAHDGLPDPTCTPGETDPRVTQADIGSTICRRGYTASVRPPAEVTHQIKIERTRAYGIPDVPFSEIELDHLIPLSLGGASTDKNLWPELRRGAHNAADKDKVEQALQDRVCQGRESLAEAQRAIAADWQTAGR